MVLNANGCRLVSKNEVVIQKGDRAGEIVYRVSLSDGINCINDISADILPAEYENLKCFDTVYNCTFDYSQKAFNGKSYTVFAVKKFLPVKDSK